MRFLIRGLVILAIVLCGHAEEVGKEVRLHGVSVDGHEIDISTSQGRLVLIAIWATWCPICLGELPELEHFYERNRQGFDLVSLNIDDDDQTLFRFLAQARFSFPVIRRFRDGETDNLDDLGVTPVFYLVGRDGRIIWRRVGPIMPMLSR